ncbi:hypothetical protein VNO78_31659 [Psophocarpus tetragonolobus]|uniref:Uncharacterized protein n=1 Tax=Psophocarpus tetragonolobus TaxID=3891 RepID=A0AAN9RYI2_PSOTE
MSLDALKDLAVAKPMVIEHRKWNVHLLYMFFPEEEREEKVGEFSTLHSGRVKVRRVPPQFGPLPIVVGYANKGVTRTHNKNALFMVVRWHCAPGPIPILFCFSYTS